jgi:hypothetical protein
MLEPFTPFTTQATEKVLDVLSFAIAEQIDLSNVEQVSVLVNELPDRMAKQFIARFRLPGEVLQDQKLLCEYPKRGILNAIRYELSELGDRYPRALGWLRKVRPVIVQHRVWQAMVYPGIPVHKDLSHVRLFYQTNMAEVQPHVR